MNNRTSGIVMIVVGILMIVSNFILLIFTLLLPLNDAHFIYYNRHKEIIYCIDILVYGMFATLYGLLFLPSGSKILRHLFGGPEQRDERFHLIWQTSATSTLYWLLGLLFVAGSLYDIFVTHQWPVRSLGEVLGICLIWAVAYRYWNKRL